MQEKERSALNSAARIAAETDLQKFRQKRKAELEMQAELAFGAALNHLKFLKSPNGTSSCHDVKLLV